MDKCNRGLYPVDDHLLNDLQWTKCIEIWIFFTKIWIFLQKETPETIWTNWNNGPGGNEAVFNLRNPLYAVCKRKQLVCQTH